MGNIVLQWFNRPRGISWHLSSFAVVLAIPAMILAAVVGYQYTSTERSKLFDSALRWAHAAAANVDNELVAANAVMDVLASSSEIAKGDFGSFFVRVKQLRLPGGSWVVVSDRDDNVVVSTRMNKVGPYGISAKKEINDFVFQNKKKLTTGIYFGSNSNEWITVVAEPVFGNDGVVLYCVMYVIPAHRWLDLLNEVSLPEGWFITLDDAEGAIIARTINHDKYVGKNSVQPVYDRIRAMTPGDDGTWDDIVSIDNRPVIGSYYKMSGSGWVVTVSAGSSVYSQPLLHAVTVASLTTIAMWLSSWLAARILTRRLSNAIHMLEVKSDALKSERVISIPPTIVSEVNIAIVAMREAATLLIRRQQTESLMLRELNHRVKNSLQNVASVLRLQQRVSPPEVREALNNASLRVTAIGRVHEGLYNMVDMSASSVYLGKLLHDVSTAMMVDFDTEIHNMSLDIDLAVPMSLMMTEAVVNAIKHGKPADRPDYTPVHVYFGPHGDIDHWKLIVRDYGKGFPTGFEDLRHTTVGIKLMKMMATQLNGEIIFGNHPDGGAVVTVTGAVRVPKVGME